MKRLALIGLLLAAFWPTAANAAVPCRNKIYNEWYASGKIATTFPLKCYRDALKHVSNDAQIYSSLVDDIKSAMQAAVQRAHHKNVPAAVGKGRGVAAYGKGGKAKHGKGKHGKGGGTSTNPTDTNSTTTTAAIGNTSGRSGGGGGIPTPIIILGALAILLAIAGATGTGVRYYRRRGSPPPAV